MNKINGKGKKMTIRGERIVYEKKADCNRKEKQLKKMARAMEGEYDGTKLPSRSTKTVWDRNV